MGLGVKSAYAVSPGFTQWDDSTVEWKVDGTKLIIQPLDNAPEGTMPDVRNDRGVNSLPWNAYRSTIATVEFNGSVKSGRSLKGLFLGMSALKNINFGDFDTSQAENMYGMFVDCDQLTSLDLSSFNTSNVKIAGVMFYNCPRLARLDLSGFNTSSMTDISAMFSDCPQLTSLNLSSFNTSNVTNMTNLFLRCSSLRTIYVGVGWNTSKVIQSTGMFGDCSNLRGGAGTAFNASYIDKARAHIDGVGGAGYLTRGYETPSLPTLNGGSLTYGYTPSFEGGSATFGQNRTPVEGTWSLDLRAPKPQAGATKLSVVFTPNDFPTHQKYYTTITIPAVAKRAVTVTPDALSKEYGAAERTLTYTDNLAEGDTQEEVFTGSLSRVEGTDPGEYDIQVGSLTLKADGKAKNYSFDATTGFTTGIKFTINPKGSVAVPKDANAVRLTYNATAQSPQVDHVIFSGDHTSEINANENGYDVTATPDPGFVWSDTGLNFDHSPQTVKWFITKKDITVTAEDKQSEVGKQEKLLTFTVDTLAPGDIKEDVFSGSLIRANSDVTAPNTYDILRGSLTTEGTTKGANYHIATFNKGTYTITSAGNVVPPTPQSLTYNGEEQDAFAGIDLTKFDIEGNIQINANAEGEHYTATITPKGSYVWSDTQDQKPLPINWTISPLSITVQARDAESTFNESLASFDYTVSPALPTTDTQDQVFTGSLACDVTSTSNPGEYQITKGDLNLNTEQKGKNYILSSVTEGTYTLRELGKIAIPKAQENLIYDRTMQTGVEPAEHVKLQNNTAINADDYEATATLEAGYIWSDGNSIYDREDKTIPFSIGKRPITVTADNKTMYAGDTIPSLSYTLSEKGYEDDIKGELFINEDTNTAGKYEIRTSKLTSHNLDLTFGKPAYLTVEAKPVFPSGGDTPGGTSFPGSSTQQPGWVSNDGHWYLFDDKGNTLTGWQAVDNTWYYLNNAGQMQTGWVYTNGIWYYLDTTGAMQTGWFSDAYNWYYLSESGAMLTGWIYTDDTWYLADASGAMKTGWEYVDDAWYHLDQTGAMTTGWYSDGYNWYYLVSSGEMVTGWYSDGTSWYYLNDSGAMATGTHSIDGVIYTFDSSGAWVA